MSVNVTVPSPIHADDGKLADRRSGIIDGTTMPQSLGVAPTIH